VPEFEGRGEIAQAIVAAVRDAGMRAINLGAIPTPALMHYALARGKGSIMVTGSHIPFDRNGYKTNTSKGELLKQQEAPIQEQVLDIRQSLYAQPFDQSLFDEHGFFKTGHRSSNRTAGSPRCLDRTIHQLLPGRISRRQAAPGLSTLRGGARPAGGGPRALERGGDRGGTQRDVRPIDTENIGAPQLATIQALADEATAKHGPLDAIVSTDGDSDRPLVVGVDPATAKAHFFGGDLVGMVVAEYLKSDAVVVPISCNDAVDRGNLSSVVEAKTRIGSPFVIAAWRRPGAKGKPRLRMGTEWRVFDRLGHGTERRGLERAAYKGRDFADPRVLFAASDSGLNLVDLFDRLPKRFSRAALLENFPRSLGLKIVAVFSAGATAQKLLAKFFTPEMGFGAIVHVDCNGWGACPVR